MCIKKFRKQLQMELSFLVKERLVMYTTPLLLPSMSTGKVTVHHIPRVVSSVYLVFIRQSGSISCIVHGTGQY